MYKILQGGTLINTHIFPHMSKQLETARKVDDLGWHLTKRWTNINVKFLLLIPLVENIYGKILRNHIEKQYYQWR